MLEPSSPTRNPVASSLSRGAVLAPWTDLNDPAIAATVASWLACAAERADRGDVDALAVALADLIHGGRQ